MTWVTRFWLAAFATFGAASAHTLAYMAVVPDARTRAAFLASTGHRNWDLIAALALGALAVGLAGFVLNRMSADPRIPASRVGLYRFAACRLVVVQCLAFVLMEGIERALYSGGDAGDGQLLIIGLLVQAAVALTVALLLVFLARAVDYLASAMRALGRLRIGVLGVGYLDPRPLRIGPGRSGWTLRGPPPRAAHHQ